MEKIIIISGSTASGKTSLLNKCSNKNIKRIKTYTTRDNRDGGVEYNFVTISDFKKMIDDNKFIEWEEVYNGRFYGTPKEELESLWYENKTPVLIVDVKGALKLKEIFKEKALTIFIDPLNKETLIQRLQHRGKDDNLDQRINKIEFELSFKNEFDEIVINQNIDTASSNLNNIIDNFISNKKVSDTLIVNLFAAPSTGKSTLASYLFALLKFQNINAEIQVLYHNLLYGI